MMGSSGFGYMSIISFLFPVFLISLILLTYKGISGDAIKEQPNPMAILKNRYAKGEITKKEYEEIKKELSG
ncbi:MAG: SHOCT domain-containing protein [Candidatus Aenigmarchaeota archaeon]|nr:SHOCT domain-containing protein [Candidatus Aenigmarchaeota archaeon]